MSPSTFFNRSFSNRYQLSVYLLAVILLYSGYLYGLSKNPPGFYLDETFISYNAYLISQTGRSDIGEFLPIYFPTFQKTDGTFDGYVNPVYVYFLAGVNLVLPPSPLLSRTFSATVVFLACLLLGLLAWKISQRQTIGIIIALTALLMPWLFQLSRLVFEATLYPLVLVLFLLALYHAHLKARWSFFDCSMLALTLGLTTYTYTIGRLLGFLFALGLVFFITDFNRLKDVVKTWLLCGLIIIPFLIYNLTHPGVLVQRFSSSTYITPDKTFEQILETFLKNYFYDIGWDALLLTGDPILRHHVPGMGLLFAATFILGLLGIVFVLFSERTNPWYRFLLYGLLISVLPGALTLHRAHMLRLIAFPIFLLLFNVPVLKWLLNSRDKEGEKIDNLIPTPLLEIFKKRTVRLGVLAVLLVSILVQASYFQMQFNQHGTNRGYLFDRAYPILFAEAAALQQRPIYLEDGFWGPGYIHGFYYAAVMKLDNSQLVHLKHGEHPPAGSIVLSSEPKCNSCDILIRLDNYILYKTK